MEKLNKPVFRFSTEYEILLLFERQDEGESFLSELKTEFPKSVLISNDDNPLDAFINGEYDLLIIDDLTFESIDNSLWEECLAKKPDASSLVILGSYSKDIILQIVQVGFTTYLVKPFSGSQFLGRVRKFAHRDFEHIENARLRTLLPLYDLGKKFIECKDYEEIYQRLIAAIEEVMTPSSISIMVPDAESGCLKIVAGRNISDSLKKSVSLKPGEKIAGWVFANKEPVVLNKNTQKKSSFSPHLKRSDISASISFPLVKSTEIFGVINISQKDKAIVYRNSDIETMSIIADFAAMAIENVSNINRREDFVRLQTLMGQYVAPEVAAELADKEESPLEIGQVQELTVLFADIRNYTMLIQKLPLFEMRKFLNEFFDLITRHIYNHQGTLDKYMGDAVLAIFGAPKFLDNQSHHAVASAIEIVKSFKLLRDKWLVNYDFFSQVELGLGISRGAMFIGNIGSSQRLDYTVIGTDVNIAQRLASETDGGQILVTETVKEELEKTVQTKKVMRKQLRGVSQERTIYEVCPT